MKRLNSTPYLRDKWKQEAGALPLDAPSYVKELAQRVLWLIADVEQQEGEFEQIKKILEPS